MKIYIAHSRDYDYQNELYLPIKNSDIFKEHEFILPHESNNYKHDRDFYKNIDLVIAEVSFPSTGLGIELGFLYDDNKPIYCIHQTDKKFSGSINVITKNIYGYNSQDEMVEIIKEIIERV